MTAQVDTLKLKNLLAKRFAPPAWALLWEVGNSTGHRQRTWADAVAMSLWPSRGLSLHGFEIKADRRDWLRELKNPAKSEPVQKYCDYWTVVAAPGVVESGELPTTWGLLVAQGRRGLVVEKDSPALSAQPVDRHFLAALLRRQADAQGDYIHRSEIAAELASARHDERENFAASRDAQVEAAQRLADLLTKTVTDFENASGIAIRDWRGTAKIGAAVRMVLSHEWKNEEERLRQVAREYHAIATRIDEAVGEEPPTLQVEKSA